MLAEDAHRRPKHPCDFLLRKKLKRRDGRGRDAALFDDFLCGRRRRAKRIGSSSNPRRDFGMGFEQGGPLLSRGCRSVYCLCGRWLREACGELFGGFGCGLLGGPLAFGGYIRRVEFRVLREGKSNAGRTVIIMKPVRAVGQATANALHARNAVVMSPRRNHGS